VHEVVGPICARLALMRAKQPKEGDHVASGRQLDGDIVAAAGGGV